MSRSPSQILFSVVLLLLTATGGWGMYANFIPTAAWQHSAKWLSLALAIPITLAIWWAYGSGHWQFRRAKSLYRKALTLLALPLAFGCLLWLSVGYGLPAIITHWAGKPYYASYRLHKYQPEHPASGQLITRSLKGLLDDQTDCHYRLSGPALERAMPHYLCTTASNYRLLKPNDIEDVFGQQSLLGVNIDHYHRHHPLALRRSDPVYPQAAAAEHIAGYVMLQFDIDTHGKPQHIQVTQSHPAQLFNAAAITAVKKWRYKPLVVAGKAQPQQQKLMLRFSPYQPPA